jgi:hypothetical protein
MVRLKFFNILTFLTLLIFVSCQTKQQKSADIPNTIDTSAFLQQGDTISSLVQKVLLANVMQAMKSGGPGFAVTYCNEKAMPLTDSLSKLYNCVIQRVSDKYRNSSNKLSGTDAEALKTISTSMNPVLISENERWIYYKPIKIAMPACLNCHGTAGKEMDPKTAEIIRIKYPEDKATGYKEGDIRGLWKISFKAH